ncbi:ABC transporter ATP-binding protein [Candidatus Spongiisocius sp.]|uniref:ABC transporter ATP-binding protein n=1 Tax=Candidatus Spongiisocius sp. TaxID=3101273 RepID=UPI003B58DC37
MTDVSLVHLGRAFGDKWAVKDLNLEIASGEMVALLGPSGCGKTTTLRMITGLARPTTGDVLFNGSSVVDVATERREAVLIFQQHLLFPTMTVAQNVGFGLKMAGMGKGEINRRVEEMLDRVELSGLGTRKAHELSGGQQQRVALARGLVTHPKVLLLDEPLANLDANLRITMRHLIRSIQRDLGITAIFVTHDQEEAVMLADRIALMFDGTLQQVGKPDEFYRHPRTAGIASFFRSQNFLPGTRRGNVVSTGAGDLVVGHNVADTGDGPVVVTARPETLTLSNRAGGENCLPATVTSAIYMGTHTQVFVQLADTTWTVHAPPSATLKTGDQVLVELPKEHIWILEDDSGA